MSFFNPGIEELFSSITNEHFNLSCRTIKEKCVNIEKYYENGDYETCCSYCRDVAEGIMRYLYKRILLKDADDEIMLGDIFRDKDFPRKLKNREIIESANSINNVAKNYKHNDKVDAVSDEVYNKRVQDNVEVLKDDVKFLHNNLSVFIEKAITYINEKIPSVPGSIEIDICKVTTAGKLKEKTVLNASVKDVTDKSYRYEWYVEGCDAPLENTSPFYELDLHKNYDEKTIICKAISKNSNLTISKEFGPLIIDINEKKTIVARLARCKITIDKNVDKENDSLLLTANVVNIDKDIDSSSLLYRWSKNKNFEETSFTSDKGNNFKILSAYRGEVYCSVLYNDELIGRGHVDIKKSDFTSTVIAPPVAKIENATSPSQKKKPVEKTTAKNVAPDISDKRASECKDISTNANVWTESEHKEDTPFNNKIEYSKKSSNPSYEVNYVNTNYLPQNVQRKATTYPASRSAYNPYSVFGRDDYVDYVVPYGGDNGKSVNARQNTGIDKFIMNHTFVFCVFCVFFVFFVYIICAIGFILSDNVFNKTIDLGGGWGDSSNGRKSYTLEQINSGVLEDSIVFNSISDSVIGDEKNFVAAKVAGMEVETWNADSIDVKIGETYTVRMYVHNNSPLGTIALAKGVTATFSIPIEISNSQNIIGYLDCSNSSPKRYWDGVTFKSAENFYLEYVEGSAMYINNWGLYLIPNEVITTGALLGYELMNGEIPGCYEYSGVLTINVIVKEA